MKTKNNLRDQSMH